MQNPIKDKQNEAKEFNIFYTPSLNSTCQDPHSWGHLLSFWMYYLSNMIFKSTVICKARHFGGLKGYRD